MTAVLTAFAIAAACFIVLFFYVGFFTWLDATHREDPIDRLLNWMMDWWEKRL